MSWLPLIFTLTVEVVPTEVIRLSKPHYPHVLVLTLIFTYTVEGIPTEVIPFSKLHYPHTSTPAFLYLGTEGIPS